MALYLIGDVQGCDGALQHMFDELAFSPSRDSCVLLGDLVNRGPQSAAVLRRVMRLEGAARCVLGNHDLHLLAASCGARALHPRDTLQDVLDAPDAAVMLDWLRRQPLALAQQHGAHTLLMVHAGVLPSWDATQTIALTAELTGVLAGSDYTALMHRMYGNQPDRWTDGLTGWDRWRVIINALTRLRFCTADGRMEFDSKEGASAAPVGYMPWFDVPSRASGNAIVAFGHWSTLGWLDRADIVALDTGCVWGGALTAVEIDPAPAAKSDRCNPLVLRRLQVRCPQAQRP